MSNTRIRMKSGEVFKVLTSYYELDEVVQTNCTLVELVLHSKKLVMLAVKEIESIEDISNEQ